jgi:hypothetical protein
MYNMKPTEYGQKEDKRKSNFINNVIKGPLAKYNLCSVSEI